MKNCEEIDLKTIYDELNEKYFYNELPNSSEVKLEWSNRLTASAGNCYKERKHIKLSTHYHIKYPEEVRNTLAHEMIHLKIRGHGKEFKKELERLNNMGLPVRMFSKERAVIQKLRWEYSCKNPNCDNHFFRTRRIPKNMANNIVCAKCRSKIVEKYIGDN